MHLRTLLVASLLSAVAFAQPKEAAVDPYAEAWKEVSAAGDDKTKLAAGLAKLDAAVVAHPSGEGHYLRGRVLNVLGRVDDALAAQTKAVELDPKHIPARYSLGVLLAKKGQHNAAVVQWTVAATAPKPHPDAAYNAGQSHYDRGRFEDALKMWQIAKTLLPNDFGAAKKVVQALHAAGRHAEASTAMADVKRIFASSKDPGVKRQKQTVIDQLKVGGRKVMVYEALEVYDPKLHYHWAAVVFDAKGKRDFSVQLESSAYGREAGTPFLDGATFANANHKGYGTAYKALPPYGEWRKLAVERIEGLLKDGSK